MTGSSGDAEAHQYHIGHCADGHRTRLALRRLQASLCQIRPTACDPKTVSCLTGLANCHEVERPALPGVAAGKARTAPVSQSLEKTTDSLQKMFQECSTLIRDMEHSWFSVSYLLTLLRSAPGGTRTPGHRIRNAVACF